MNEALLLVLDAVVFFAAGVAIGYIRRGIIEKKLNQAKTVM